MRLLKTQSGRRNEKKNNLSERNIMIFVCVQQTRNEKRVVYFAFNKILQKQLNYWAHALKNIVFGRWMLYVERN